MAAAAPAVRDDFSSDLRSALETSTQARVESSRSRAETIFLDWTQFAASLGHEPHLPNIANQEQALCLLLVYGARRRRRPGRGGNPILAKTVSQALQCVGQGITRLGGRDPRMAAPGSKSYHPLLNDYIEALNREDDPASRAHPVNTTILRNLPNVLEPTNPRHRHATHLCIIGFFWLLRPAEYLKGTGQTRSQAFRLCDVSFTLAGRIIPAIDLSLNDVQPRSITHATLTFTDQKNAVKGEKISHAATSDSLLCPCKALFRICKHLRRDHAPATTPLYTFFANHEAKTIGPTDITAYLRKSAKALHHLTGIDPAHLSARSLRPGGATALLCANIDADVIQLLGRWKSDAMLRYLRVAALAHSSNLADRMLAAGAYTFAPNTCTEDNAQPIPKEAPRDFLDAMHRHDLYQLE